MIVVVMIVENSVDCFVVEKLFVVVVGTYP